MINDKRVLHLAYNGALDIWSTSREHLEKIPYNKLAQLRERKAWEELEEIGSRLLDLENIHKDKQ